MKHRMLIAGVGNIFLGDDGFGVEVVSRMASQVLPGWVRVVDFGIRGVHLAYDLLDHDCEITVLVDTIPRGGQPGTVYLIEPEWDALQEASAAPDAHAMNVEAVFGTLKALGGKPRKIYIVGCEPACIEEQIGLSPQVAGAVEDAVRLIRELIERAGRPRARTAERS